MKYSSSRRYRDSLIVETEVIETKKIIKRKVLKEKESESGSFLKNLFKKIKPSSK